MLTLGSLIWIGIGYISGEYALMAQNIVLTLINIFGVYRWLGAKPSSGQGPTNAAATAPAPPREAPPLKLPTEPAAPPIAVAVETAAPVAPPLETPPLVHSAKPAEPAVRVPGPLGKAKPSGTATVALTGKLPVPKVPVSAVPTGRVLKGDL